MGRITSRTERKMESRRLRLEELSEGTRMAPKRKSCKRNRGLGFSLVGVFLVIAVFSGFRMMPGSFFVKAESMPKEDPAVLYSDIQVMTQDYNQKLESYGSMLYYDKALLEVKAVGEKEYSFIQQSTAQTNSLISAFEGKNGITKIGVVGVDTPNNYHFARGYKENMLMITAIAMDCSIEEARELLTQNEIFSQQGDIFLKPVVFEFQEKEFIFYIENNTKFFFTIYNKTKLIEMK